jgi:hypothetical protein
MEQNHYLTMKVWEILTSSYQKTYRNVNHPVSWAYLFIMQPNLCDTTCSNLQYKLTQIKDNYLSYFVLS